MASDAHDRNPFVGPRPFERGERARFFGRDRETRELASLATAHRTLLLYAQSGAGKTSLINAGLIPLLEEEAFEVLPVARVWGRIPEEIASDPETNPYVLNALISWVGEEDVDPRSLAQTSLAGFMAERARPSDEMGLPVPRVAILDQFEDLFNAYPDRWEERAKFFEQVSDALQADPLLRVILVVREDYMASLDPYVPLLPDRLRTRMRLERMRKGAALAAATGPLQGAGRVFAEGVAEQMVGDLLQMRAKTAEGETVAIAGEFVEPVQLQVVCHSLWRDLPPDVIVITQDHLEAFGDVNQALSQFYERCLQQTVKQAKVSERALRNWFGDKLITPAGTRGTAFGGEHETEGLPNAAVNALVNLHLIRRERRAGADWYELTHDRFIEPVQRSNLAWEERARRKKARTVLAVLGTAVIIVLVLGSVLVGITRMVHNTEATATASASETASALAALREAYGTVIGAKANAAAATAEVGATAAEAQAATAAAQAATAETRAAGAEATATYAEGRAAAAETAKATLEQALTASCTVTPTATLTATVTAKPTQTLMVTLAPTPTATGTATGTLETTKCDRALVDEGQVPESWKMSVARGPVVWAAPFGKVRDQLTVDERERLGDPRPLKTIKARFTLQKFKSGWMYWFENPYSVNNIWLLYAPAFDFTSGSRWQRCADDRPKGGPESSCDEARANGLAGPLRGFGWLWCEDHGVRELVGRPSGPEFGSGEDSVGLGQFFQGGVMFFKPRQDDPLNTADQVFVLFEDGRWRLIDLPQ